MKLVKACCINYFVVAVLYSSILRDPVNYSSSVEGVFPHLSFHGGATSLSYRKSVFIVAILYASHSLSAWVSHTQSHANTQYMFICIVQMFFETVSNNYVQPYVSRVTECGDLLCLSFS